MKLIKYIAVTNIFSLVLKSGRYEFIMWYQNFNVKILKILWKG